MYYATALAFVSLGGAIGALAGALPSLARLVDTGALVPYSRITIPSLIQHAKESIEKRMGVWEHLRCKLTRRSSQGWPGARREVGTDLHGWMTEFNKWQGATAKSDRFWDVLAHQFTELMST